jgi:hypothetical protein
MDADIATALELVLEENCVPHFDAEVGNKDVATEKDIPVCGFVSPFVKEVGEASLTIRVDFGRTGRSRCK